MLGVTGGLGTGKTTVAKFFEDLGAVVLNADKLAHEAYEPGSETAAKIAAPCAAPISCRRGAPASGQNPPRGPLTLVPLFSALPESALGRIDHRQSDVTSGVNQPQVAGHKGR